MCYANPFVSCHVCKKNLHTKEPWRPRTTASAGGSGGHPSHSLSLPLAGANIFYRLHTHPASAQTRRSALGWRGQTSSGKPAGPTAAKRRPHSLVQHLWHPPAHLYLQKWPPTLARLRSAGCPRSTWCVGRFSARCCPAPIGLASASAVGCSRTLHSNSGVARRKIAAARAASACNHVHRALNNLEQQQRAAAAAGRLPVALPARRPCAAAAPEPSHPALPPPLLQYPLFSVFALAGGVCTYASLRCIMNNPDVHLVSLPKGSPLLRDYDGWRPGRLPAKRGPWPWMHATGFFACIVVAADAGVQQGR